jgi:alkylresorcinol/alkylpyrone synthase
MPRIVDTATAVPQYQVDQATAREFARSHFGSRFKDIDRLLPVFDNSGIRTRYFCRPAEWLAQPHSLEEKNQVYIESATELSGAAALKVMQKNQLTPKDIDAIIYVNSTGLATPSIDARLVNQLEFRRDIHRTPLWGLGCAGGAAGLAHAYRYLMGQPKGRVLLIATELCGLTFLSDDYSPSNLVATALFSEGSAAVLLAGDRVPGEGLEIIGTRSTFYPDSLEVMGWNVVAKGLQVVFARRIPDIVDEHAGDDIGNFLADHDLDLNDISAWLLHPGGTKVLQAYESALGLTADRFTLSRGVLDDYGNMSSATVLFVLERYLRQSGQTGNGIGLISALGPGFCSESMLVKL